MSEYYSATGSPATRAALASATIRSEFSSIASGFGKLPTLAGNGDALVVVNAGGTALTTLASLPVAQGGTGAATLTDGGILLGSGTNAVTATARMADGEMLVGTPSGDPAIESGATLRTSFGLGSGNTPTFAALTLTAPLTVPNGGTGAATLTNGGVLLGSGTGAITAMAVLGAGEMIVGDGTTDPVAQSGNTLRTSFGLGTGDQPTFDAVALNNPLNVVYGGTGQTSLPNGHVLVGSGTGGVSAIDITARGSILVGDGSGDPRALPVGTNGYVLTADSGETTGLSWTAIGGGGGVGTLTTIKRNNVQVGGADIAILDFSDQFTVSESPNTEIQVGINLATESVVGVVELANQTQVNAGTVGNLAVKAESLAAWPGSSNLTTVGAISSGSWAGTPIPVTSGGTGSTSASAARTALGLGTGNSPTFVTVNLSGVLALSDGGTGSSSASGARSNLGLGSLATANTINNNNWSGADLEIANGGTGASTAGDARLALGLGSIATQSSINNNDWVGADLAVVNGGTGSSTVAGARSNLGLGSLATLSTINNSNWSGTDLAVVNGGTGAGTASGARTNLGIGSMATRDVTISTSAPSGGSDGDIWLRYS